MSQDKEEIKRLKALLERERQKNADLKKNLIRFDLMRLSKADTTGYIL